MPAGLFVEKLVENQRKAADDGGIIAQGRPLTVAAPFPDDDSDSGSAIRLPPVHEPPFGVKEHAWGSETHRVLVCGGHTMNAYSG
eukprot:1346660-Alexandrium_andersonii.AAC.1